MVRFAPGTAPDAMRQAVANAGAEVLTDLTALNALAVVPKDASSFAANIKAQRGVKAAWVDHVNKASALDPDPLHDLDSFQGENAPGVLQWEDDRDGVRQAWNTTCGAGIKVAVIDPASTGDPRELRKNVLFVDNTIPCNRLARSSARRRGLLHDCSKRTHTDTARGWPAASPATTTASVQNGIAPDAKVMGYKALATGLRRPDQLDRRRDGQCLRQRRRRHQHVVGGFNDPNDPDFAKENNEDYFLWQDAVDYCRARGTTIVASAGNEQCATCARP